MHRRILFGLLALALTSNAWAAKGGQGNAGAELKGFLEKWGESWNQGDVEAIKAGISDKIWEAWDYDLAAQPTGWKTKAEVTGFFDTTFAMMKKIGASTTHKFNRIDCKTSGTLGICRTDSTFTITMPKMPPMSSEQHSTEVFEKEKGGWKWVYHHNSITKDGPFPAKTIAANADAKGNWVDAGPGMEGIKVFPLWMNAANMYSAAIMKATQTVKQSRHIHPYPFTFAVLEGSLTTSDASGKDVEYGKGSVVYRAANEPHRTTINEGAVVFAVAAGPMQQIPVDDNGRRINSMD